MKLPSNTAALVLALAVLSASASPTEAAKDMTYPAPIERKGRKLAAKTKKDKTGLRKGHRRAQAQQRAIICEAQGGVGHSGEVGTAPAYDQCYLSGCNRQTFGCTTSSQCAPGACCMPTNIHGSYCVEVEPLYGLNKYIAPKCLCREGKPSEAGVGDAIIDTDTGDVTVIGGGEQDSQGQQPQPQPQPQPQQQTQPATPANSGTSTTSTTPATPNTPTTPTRPAVSPLKCDGCTINGECKPAGSVWLLEDNCSRCTCKNASGMGDYRCTGCSGGGAVEKPAVVEEKPEVEEKPQQPATPTPTRPVVTESITDITDSDDMMEEPEPQQPEPEEEEEIELLDDPEPVRPAVIAKPNPDNIANGGGTNAASASSHTGTGGFGVESTTPYGDGKIVCQASGGVANRGSIPTVANYEDCYGGKCGRTGMCEQSSQCAGGACCMPTLYGSYCTDVTYLVTTYNKFAAPWCKCDLAENKSANRAGDFGFAAGGAQQLGGDGSGSNPGYELLQAELDIVNSQLLDPSF